jgi:hypothetical protein
MIPKGSRVIATYIYDNPHSKYVKSLKVYATGDLHSGNGMNFFYRDGITDGFPFDPINQKRTPHPYEGDNYCLSFEELGMYYECFVDVNGSDVLKFTLNQTDLQKCMRDGL